MQEQTLQYLNQLHSAYNELKAHHFDATQDFRIRSLEQIEAVQCELIEAAFDGFAPPSIGGLDLRQQVQLYAKQNSWTYIDVTALLSCIESVTSSTYRTVAQHGLIYLAFRMIDDFIDGHESYKGAYATYYNKVKESRNNPDSKLGLALLPALVLIVQGLASSNANAFRFSRETLIGALMELRGNDQFTIELYDQMVDGKMVSYSISLYSPALELVRIPHRTALTDFLVKSFQISQIANDLYDTDDDLSNNQPNFWNLFPDHAESEREFLSRFNGLRSAANSLPSNLHGYSNSRIADLTNYILQRYGDKKK